MRLTCCFINFILQIFRHTSIGKFGKSSNSPLSLGLVEVRSCWITRASGWLSSAVVFGIDVFRIIGFEKVVETYKAEDILVLRGCKVEKVRASGHCDVSPTNTPIDD